METTRHVNSINGKCGDCRGHRCLDTEAEISGDPDDPTCANCGHEVDQYPTDTID